MKFDKMLAFAREHGLDYVVTGHYARIEQDPATGRWLLKKALYAEKDQSYVLYVLTQDRAGPHQVPAEAAWTSPVHPRARRGGRASATPASTTARTSALCPTATTSALWSATPANITRTATFIDVTTGNVVGRHHGAVRYTCGQRKGLGLALGAPVYVCGKDMEKNTVTVGPESELFKTTLIAGDFNWISVPELTAPMRVKAKARYRQAEQPATAYPLENGLVKVVFDEPQRAITRGQAVVLYDGDVVVGGGTIL